MVTKADYGLRCTESLMKYDPSTHSLRTHQLSLFGGWIECSRTLPRFGLMQDGECFQQPMLEHDTDVRGYGSQGSIGTPIKSRSYRSDDFRSGALSPYELCKNDGGVPKIEWLEHLMGWPIGWTDLEPLETGKFQQWSCSHGEV
jgi:hypothetical protein